MPNHKSCEKRLRQEVKRSARNHYVKMTIKTLEKKMRGDMPTEEKQKLLDEVYSKLDRAAKKRVIHPRTAARRKSRISLHFNKELANVAN